MQRILHAPAKAWNRYGRALALIGVAYLIVAAAGRLQYALPHLLRDVADWSAVDLKYRYGEVEAWFAGRPVYGVVDGAVYPPASHLILWPFLGWLPLSGARLLWAITILSAAASVAVLGYRLSAPAPPRERLLVAGLVFAAYPLQQAVFVGQLGIHVTAFAACGAALLFVARPRLSTDVLGGALLAASLVKPTLSTPLVAAALIAAGRMRPAWIAGGAYAAFTLAAARAQPDGLAELLRDWLAIAGRRVPFGDGVPNLHMLLDALGRDAWMTPASVLVLAVLAAWLWRRRVADPWLLMGVAGITARLWAHSTAYDDAFLLLPTIALFRLASAREPHGDRVAGMLFAATWVALLTPTWAFYDLAPLVVWMLHAAHTVLWLVVLAFLVAAARRQVHGLAGTQGAATFSLNQA